MPTCKPEHRKKCPICHKRYRGYSAISRRDNKTEICNNCGVEEAMQDYLNRKQGFIRAIIAKAKKRKYAKVS